MVEFALKAFLTLFVLIDPIGLIPLFLALVGTRSYQEQKRIALKATTVAGLIVLLFALLGGVILRYLGISLEALKVAGGLLLFRIALDMINAQLERETDEEQAESQVRADISVFPLAIPLIAGPGTLAGVLILAGSAPSGVVGFGLVLAMAALVLFLTYWSLRAALKFSSSLGRTGINVITRVLGILLAALAVQYVADGVRVLLGLV
ncbi:MarC family protein [Meiothermus rufus]|uniref:MarC family protein n=1 Tax=Meiothermus rufus TaxID=604332 RepID=UPI0003F5F399|nr:MarC family protein [Meiothermus rufus]